MILHIVSQHNWTKVFLSYFEESFPRENIVVYLNNDGKIDLIHNGVTESYQNANQVSKRLKSFNISIIVIQLLTYPKKRFVVDYLSPDIPVIWWVFGGDLYNRYLYRSGYELYAPQTKPFLRRESFSYTYKIKLFLFNLYSNYLDKKILKRVKGVIPCDIPDYNFVCSYMGRKVDLAFLTPYQDILSLPLCSGNDILVCHSASLTNNHLYALDLMKSWDIGDSKLYIPLSYNVQNEQYKNEVIKQFKTVFGDKSCCLLDFEDFECYIKRYLTYKVAIFATWRQEALGNIEICFQLGVKVLLSNHNPYLNYFKGQGLKVYAMEDVKSSEDLAPLSIMDKEYNRRVFYKIILDREKESKTNLKNFFSRYVKID